VTNAKVAMIDFGLNKAKMRLGVEINVSDQKSLNDIRQRESDITMERIQKILATGANVVLSTAGIDDLCMKYFVEAGAMAVRRCKKEDLRRIARHTGGKVVTDMSDLEGNEVFDVESLGSAEEVSQERICDDELILIKGGKAHTSASIILRGANDSVCDELERAIHDALCVVKRVLESKKVVVGGGSVEAALSIYLENFARTLSSRYFNTNSDESYVVFFIFSSRADCISKHLLRRLDFYSLYSYFIIGNNWPLPSLPDLCWSFPRRWRSTQPRTRQTWSLSCAPTTTPASKKRTERTSSIPALT